MKDKLKGELEDETMTEKEKLKLITEDMKRESGTMEYVLNVAKNGSYLM